MGVLVTLRVRSGFWQQGQQGKETGYRAHRLTTVSGDDAYHSVAFRSLVLLFKLNGNSPSGPTRKFAILDLYGLV
jgi:hypothetical protein